MANASYGVKVESGCDTTVACTVTGGPEAYNTARAIAHAVCRINVGAVVAVLRNGRVTERYESRAIRGVEVFRSGPRRTRED
jgi:hypothetical protein